MADINEVMSKLELAVFRIQTAMIEAHKEGEGATVSALRDESRQLRSLMSRIQVLINKQRKIKMDVLARTLNDRIQALRAFSLTKAVTDTLELAVRATGAKVKSVVPKPPPDAGDQDGSSSSEDQADDLPHPVLVAKTTPKKGIVTQIINASVSEGIDPAMVLTFILIESDVDPKATNNVSTAGGLFQFLNSTWIEHAPQGAPAEQDQSGVSLAAKASVEEQMRRGLSLIEKNANVMRKALDVEPTDVTIYAAHNLGANGAKKLFQGDRSAPITKAISAKAAKNNRFDGLTIGETIDEISRRVRLHRAELFDTWVQPASAEQPPATSPGSPTIARQAAQEALAELEEFGTDSAGNILKEATEPLTSRIKEYFAACGAPGVTHAQPWSAAFISWVMRQAGADASQLPFAPNHARYILQGLQASEDGNEDAPLVYYDLDKMAPRVGDLLGFSRTSKVKSRDDMLAFLPNRHFDSHTDIVTDVSNNNVRLIGGNLGDRIKQLKEPLVDGKVKEGGRYLFLLRCNF